MGILNRYLNSQVKLWVNQAEDFYKMKSK